MAKAISHAPVAKVAHVVSVPLPVGINGQRVNPDAEVVLDHQPGLELIDGFQAPQLIVDTIVWSHKAEDASGRWVFRKE